MLLPHAFYIADHPVIGKLHESRHSCQGSAIGEALGVTQRQLKGTGVSSRAILEGGALEMLARLGTWSQPVRTLEDLFLLLNARRQITKVTIKGHFFDCSDRRGLFEAQLAVAADDADYAGLIAKCTGSPAARANQYCDSSTIVSHQNFNATIAPT